MALAVRLSKRRSLTRQGDTHRVEALLSKMHFALKKHEASSKSTPRVAAQPARLGLPLKCKNRVSREASPASTTHFGLRKSAFGARLPQKAHPGRSANQASWRRHPPRSVPCIRNAFRSQNIAFRVAVRTPARLKLAYETRFARGFLKSHNVHTICRITRAPKEVGFLCAMHLISLSSQSRFRESHTAGHAGPLNEEVVRTNHFGELSRNLRHGDLWFHIGLPFSIQGPERGSQVLTPHK